jgi:uncharacterized protein YbaP (TraB family)
MIRRGALLVALLAAATACKREATQPVAPQPAAAPGSGLLAGSADPWAKSEPAVPRLAHALFWSIEKDGKTTYALGTMHVGIDADAQLPEVVFKKFDGVPAFAMETDLSDIAPGDMARKDGKSLHDELGDDEWKKLERALTPAVAKQMDRMKPMVAATMLQLRGLPLTAPMDGVLLARAKREQKRVVYLEPAAKEEALLEKWMDVRALKDMLDSLDEGERQAKAMLAAYVAGDEKKLLAVSEHERDEWKQHGHDVTEYDQMMEELLYERNASWIAAIEQLHAAGGGFVATGAMHMLGKRSVLDLLAQRGYKVTRLTP